MNALLSLHDELIHIKPSEHRAAVGALRRLNREGWGHPPTPSMNLSKTQALKARVTCYTYFWHTGNHRVLDNSEPAAHGEAVGSFAEGGPGRLWEGDRG